MPINVDAIRNRVFAPVTEAYGPDRAILYALGLGVGSDANAADLTLVYEQSLKVLPSLAVVLAPDPFWMEEPELGVTFAQVLHGEQGLELHTPIPPSGTVVAQTTIDGLYDKGPKGAVLLLRRELHTAQGEHLATVRSTAFLRADGGFGGSSEGQPAPHPVPERLPDLVLPLSTRPDQALLYRLSGDYNPLHIDPVVAVQAGFPRPILHGLCSYGVAGRAIVRALCDGDPDRLLRLDARFSTPVFPGETLATEIWHEGNGRAAFRVKVVERDVIALNNGRAEYR
ncbi:MaoC/PaaZ C-terminal domain-containing protein [Sphingomonas sp. CJ20]